MYSQRQLGDTTCFQDTFKGSVLSNKIFVLVKFEHMHAGAISSTPNATLRIEKSMFRMFKVN